MPGSLISKVLAVLAISRKQIGIVKQQVVILIFDRSAEVVNVDQKTQIQLISVFKKYKSCLTDGKLGNLSFPQ